MSKRTFIAFGLLVIVLAVVIPWLIFNSKGDAQKGDQSVASDLKSGQTLFQINCGTCHTLYAAGTDGNYGPNLDELLAPTGPPEGDEKEIEAAAKGVEERVLNAVENGVDGEAPGRMPGGILNQEQAEEVSRFVGHVAGEG
ncbi:MAG TPA: cytochrome c [Solirubrobacterales bacterium]|nr:cytochrome c [Solirubrobacterales bacterium]